MKKNDEIKIITHELLASWEPCQDGYQRFCELFPNGENLQNAIDGLIADGHEDWAFWLFEKCKKENLFADIILKGYRNSGNRNSGNCNSGDWNSGNRNFGHRNSGNRNSGHQNSGDRNSGHQNSGDRNSGHWNSGNRNFGHRNSGNRNSGHQNSGDWNSGDRNSGYFNSETPDEILVFNKLCKRKDWENAYKPDFLFFDLTYWVDEKEMTDKDKIADPHFYTRGGQLKERDYKEAFKLSWDNADKKDRIKIKDLPNFDKEIFKEISGIDVDEQ